MEDTAKENNIIQGVIWKQLLLFFFPIMFGSLFQQMYNMVDTIVVGRFVGTEALAAVGASGSLTKLLIGFFTGLATGVTVVVSQVFGANDQEKVHDAIHTGAALAVAGGIVITVLGVVLTPGVLRLIDTPADIFEDAVVYTRIYFAGALFLVLYNMGSGILRAMGDSKRPMIYLIICCVINIVLDIFFVVVLEMGVIGVGLATILSEAISAFMVLIALRRLPDSERLKAKEIKFHNHLLLSIIQIGLPAGLQYVMFDFSNLIVQSGINSFGSVTIAAWTVYEKPDTFMWMVLAAFGMAITTFVGQNYGAHQFGRIRKSVTICMIMSTVAVSLIIILEVVFRVPLLHIFSEDEAVIAVGAQMMLYIVTFEFMFIPIEIYAGAMRGTGYSAVPMIVTFLGSCVFRIIWVLFVVPKWHTLFVLSLAYPISWFITGVAFCVLYWRGSWLRLNE